MAIVVTTSLPHGEGHARADDELVDRLERLWHELGDFWPLVEVATRHALDDYELRPEDEAHLDGLSSLRATYEDCAATPNLEPDTKRFLAFVEHSLLSLEGRAAICRLAAT